MLNIVVLLVDLIAELEVEHDLAKRIVLAENIVVEKKEPHFHRITIDVLLRKIECERFLPLGRESTVRVSAKMRKCEKD